MWKRSFIAALCALGLTPTLPAPVLAGDMIRAELRPGWRSADGTHIAALHLHLSPGWKTYWRAPGDAGIPPLFNWSGSHNLAAAQVNWPTPDVFWQSGMRSVGYSGSVVLPIVLKTKGNGAIRLRGEMDMGLCKDVCIPHALRFDATLPPGMTKPDPIIAASLADMPFNEAEASVQSVDCTVSASNDGVALEARIKMPSTGQDEVAVIEAGNPHVWVAEPTASRQGGDLIARTQMMHVEGRPFALDRSAVRITVLGSRYAVDIQGCD